MKYTNCSYRLMLRLNRVHHERKTYCSANFYYRDRQDYAGNDMPILLLTKCYARCNNGKFSVFRIGAQRDL